MCPFREPGFLTMAFHDSGTIRATARPLRDSVISSPASTRVISRERCVFASYTLIVSDMVRGYLPTMTWSSLVKEKSEFKLHLGHPPLDQKLVDRHRVEVALRRLQQDVRGLEFGRHAHDLGAVVPPPNDQVEG